MYALTALITHAEWNECEWLERKEEWIMMDWLMSADRWR